MIFNLKKRTYRSQFDVPFRFLNPLSCASCDWQSNNNPTIGLGARWGPGLVLCLSQRGWLQVSVRVSRSSSLCILRTQGQLSRSHVQSCATEIPGESLPRASQGWPGARKSAQEPYRQLQCSEHQAVHASCAFLRFPRCCSSSRKLRASCHVAPSAGLGPEDRDGWPDTSYRLPRDDQHSCYLRSLSVGFGAVLASQPVLTASPQALPAPSPCEQSSQD